MPPVGHCDEDPVRGECRDNYRNQYFYNRNASRCDVFTWSCGRHGNRFENVEDCMTECTGITPQLADERERIAEAEEMAEEEEGQQGTRRRWQRPNGRANG